MSDQEYAARLLANCSRRLSGVETAICHAIANGASFITDNSDFLSTEDRKVFATLKTQFAAELK